jgi:biopolymer transport protein ExbB
MSYVKQLVEEGGPVMYPILGLGFVTLNFAVERSWYWFRLLTRERVYASVILEAAKSDLSNKEAYGRAIGRFLLKGLSLNYPTPDTLRLALETAAEIEFIQMRRGNKLFELVIALAPLLGLLGTVTGVMKTLRNYRPGGTELEAVGAGISEALITTAAGIIVPMDIFSFSSATDRLFCANRE